MAIDCTCCLVLYHPAWQVYLVLGTRGLNKSLCFLLFSANASSSGTVTVQLVPGHRLWRGQRGLVSECSYHSDKEIQHGNCLIRQCNYTFLVSVLITVILQEQCAITDKPVSHCRTLVSNVCTELVEFPNGGWTVDRFDLIFSNLTEFNAHTWLCALMPFEIKIR
jgi:hypothetical protein